MKQILLTEKEMVFLVLFYFHDRANRRKQISIELNKNASCATQSSDARVLR